MIRKSPTYEHKWSILCRSTSIDKDSNTLSILNVLEGITIAKIADETIKEKWLAAETKKPITLPMDFEIIMLLERLDNKESGIMTKEGELELVSPDGKSLLKKDIQINFQKGYKRLRYRIKMNGLNVAGPGTYNFCIKIRESEEEPLVQVAEIPLDIKFN